MSVVALIKSHHRPTFVLGLLWCWCAVVIPLWCIVDCTRVAPARPHQYVCAMDSATPGHDHAPRISIETLQFLAMVLLVVLRHGIMLQAGISVIDDLRIYRDWRARPTSPPPKLLLFTSAA